ncbi:hypothetical protein N9651_01305 [Flavobacteriales bacterium]|jgi:hypothetical protein|nr:hypothetical protein [Flavobacteriales bacterium]
MALRNTPEQDLIDSFVSQLKKGEIYQSFELLHCNCNSKNYADIEFETLKEHWVIEAKSNKSGDAHNSAHKIFGELLKETGRNRDNVAKKIKYGILIPDFKFYQNKFRKINPDKYIGFGKLIPIDTVFVLADEKINRYSWKEFIEIEP